MSLLRKITRALAIRSIGIESVDGAAALASIEAHAAELQRLDNSKELPSYE